MFSFIFVVLMYFFIVRTIGMIVNNNTCYIIHSNCDNVEDAADINSLTYNPFFYDE